MHAHAASRMQRTCALAARLASHTSVASALKTQRCAPRAAPLTPLAVRLCRCAQPRNSLDALSRAQPRNSLDASSRAHTRVLTHPPTRGHALSAQARAMTTRGVEDARNKHVHTLHEVYAHPTTTKLRWQALMSMLEAFGGTHRPAGDGHKEHIELDGRTLFLSRPHKTNTITNASDVVALRHFLAAAGLAPDDSCAASAEAARQRALETPHAASARVSDASLDGKHVLCYVAHNEARLYPTLAPGAAAEHVLHAWDPNGKRRHLHVKHGVKHQSTPVFHGDYVPVDPRFLKDVMSALRGAEQILLVGHGTGKSNAADALEGAMRTQAPELAKRVVGRLVLSEGHVTQNELLAAGRAFFNTRAAEEPGGMNA